jgi:Glycosyl transferases group 1
MKLLVSWMRDLETYISREFHYTMQDLLRNHAWRHMEPCPMPRASQELKAWMIGAFGEVPQVVLFWETYDLFNSVQPALHDLGCRLALFVDDLHMLWGHEYDRGAKLTALAGCDLVLASYGYVFAEFFPELAEQRVQWIPHAASADFALPFNDQPENAILLSGFIGSLYPLRARMLDLREHSLDTIVRYQHPGYTDRFDHASDPRVGAGYARTIHRFRAGFTDALKFRYVVAKYFEIPATGALLVADGAVAEPLRQLGFQPDVHYIPVFLDNLEDKIRYILEDANRVEIDEIRRRGQQLVLGAHCTRHRARMIDDVCAR